ncbi:MAG: hypothetical protein ACI4AB_06210 [Acetatifactor sp.]
MKIKKITWGVAAISAVILIVVVVLFATSVEQEAVSEDVGIVAEGIEVPDVVMDAAKEFVRQQYRNVYLYPGEAGYSNWRMESLENVYTYEDLDGMTLQLYRINYRFLAVNPDTLVLAGPVEVDEDGWTQHDYPNSYYLVFRQEGDELIYLTFHFENDCFPGDEAFTEALRMSLPGKEAD